MQMPINLYTMGADSLKLMLKLMQVTVVVTRRSPNIFRKYSKKGGRIGWPSRTLLLYSYYDGGSGNMCVSLACFPHVEIVQLLSFYIKTPEASAAEKSASKWAAMQHFGFLKSRRTASGSINLLQITQTLSARCRARLEQTFSCKANVLDASCLIHH